MLHHEYARNLRNQPSKAQLKLWFLIKNRQLNGFKFRREHPIGNYILDFVCLEKKLVIEIDGGQHAEQTVYDSHRTRWLQTKGFKVLRFWNNEVLVNTDLVLEVIQRYL